MENKVITVQFGNKNKGTEKATQPAPKSSEAPRAQFSQALPLGSGVNSNLPSSSAVELIPQEDLRSLAERNRANQERLRKEREVANKAVLKSYRIK